MTWDFLILILMVLALAVYLVFMSMWNDEGTLRFRHFAVLIVFVVFTLLQAVTV